MRVKKLSNLKAGESGRISEVHSDMPAKLYEMGFLPGSSVLLKRIAPLGDPLHIEVEGYDIALRSEEADWVVVELEEKPIDQG